MSIWNSQMLANNGRQIIKPFDKNSIKSGAYELKPRSQILVSGQKDNDALIDGNKCMMIKPGQLAMLISREEVRIPAQTMGFISIKYSLKKKGLINVSGFHVDPGFSGHLKFTVFNASPKTLFIDPEKTCFQLWITEMIGNGDSYDGNHNNQDRFSSDEYEIVENEFPSPPIIMAELNSIRREIGLIKGLSIAVMAGIVAGIVLLIFQQIIG